MAANRNDVAGRKRTLTAREQLVVSPEMQAEMQAIADARGIARSEAWREAAAEYIERHGGGDGA